MQDRYSGIGGQYVVIDGERFPADDDQQPLPHTRNPDGTLIELEVPTDQQE